MVETLPLWLHQDSSYHESQVGGDTLRKVALFILISFNFLFAEKLIVVAEPWPPYDYYRLENGKVVPRGINLGVTVKILEEMGYDVEVRFMPWERCLMAVKMGLADVVVSASKTNDREKYFLYPDEPLSYSLNVLFYRRGLNLRNWDDLEKLRLAYVDSYYYGGLFDNLPVVKVNVRTSVQGFLMLKNGRVDLVIEDYRVGKYRIRKMGMREGVEIFPLPVSDFDPLYAAFSKKRVPKSVVEEFSRRLKEFKESEEYQDLLREYLKELGLEESDLILPSPR